MCLCVHIYIRRVKWGSGMLPKKENFIPRISSSSSSFICSISNGASCECGIGGIGKGIRLPSLLLLIFCGGVHIDAVKYAY